MLFTTVKLQYRRISITRKFSLELVPLGFTPLVSAVLVNCGYNMVEAEESLQTRHSPTVRSMEHCKTSASQAKKIRRLMIPNN